MSRRRRIGGDPYWLTVKFDGKCKECGAKVSRGARAFYYPNGRHLLGKDCCGAADKASADFQSAAFDESMMTGQW